MTPASPTTSPRGGAPRWLRVVAVVTTCLVATAAVAVPSSAAKQVRHPKKVVNIRIIAVTPSSFRVAAAPAKNAKQYRVVASTTKQDLALANVRPQYKSRIVDRPRLTLSGLAPSTTPYYFRMVSIRGTRIHYSALESVDLPPTTPTGLRVTDRGQGLYLRWKVGKAEDFVVLQATDPGFTQGRQKYRVRGTVGQLTPYRVDPGTHYWFRVRARSGSAASPYSASVKGTPTQRTQQVRVATYNILTSKADGGTRGGQRVPAWSKRKVAAAKLLSGAAPDVIAIQEGGRRVSASGTTQVESLRSQLGEQIFRIADTGNRGDCYLLYRASKFREIGTGGTWSLGNKKYAAYHVLEHVGSGARFLAVSLHLSVGLGSGMDALRQQQAQRLIEHAEPFAAARGVPVIYAGDFNSHSGKNHAFDGPGRVMTALNAPDSLDVSPTAVNKGYNSGNQYSRTAPDAGVHLDHIYAAPGIGVTGWQMLLNLQNGDFVGTMPSDHNPVVADLAVPRT